MFEILKKAKETFINKKFLKFCLAGIINTFNAAFFSWLVHFFLQDNLAAVVGYIISLTINFSLNCKFIFKRKMNLRSYLRFLLSYIPNFMIYFLVTFITINTLELEQFWGTVFAAMAGGPITFIIIKFYAFGKTGNNKLQFKK